MAALAQRARGLRSALPHAPSWCVLVRGSCDAAWQVESYRARQLTLADLDAWFRTATRQPALRSLERIPKLLSPLLGAEAPVVPAEGKQASARQAAADGERPVSPEWREVSSAAALRGEWDVGLAETPLEGLAAAYTTAARARLEALMLSADMPSFFQTSAMVRPLRPSHRCLMALAASPCAIHCARVLKKPLALRLPVCCQVLAAHGRLLDSLRGSG